MLASRWSTSLSINLRESIKDILRLDCRRFLPLLLTPWHFLANCEYFCTLKIFDDETDQLVFRPLISLVRKHLFFAARWELIS